MIRRLLFGCLAVLATAVLILAAPLIAVVATAAPMLGLRRYSMTETAWAQIQAVGFSLQIGGTIWGMAPLSWWSPERGVDKRSIWPSCLQVKIMASDHNGGIRTAFGISLGSVRLVLRIRDGFAYHPDELGWSFWHRAMRC